MVAILIEAHHYKPRAIRIHGKGEFTTIATIHDKAKPAPTGQHYAAIGEDEIIQSGKSEIL